MLGGAVFGFCFFFLEEVCLKSIRFVGGEDCNPVVQWAPHEKRSASQRVPLYLAPLQDMYQRRVVIRGTSPHRMLSFQEGVGSVDASGFIMSK